MFEVEDGWGGERPSCVSSELGVEQELEEREILAKLQILSKFTFFHSNSCSTVTVSPILLNLLL